MVLNWIMATAWNISKCGVLSGPYSVQMQENTYQEKTLFGHFSRSGRILAHCLLPFAWEMTCSKYSWKKQGFYGLLVMDFIYILAPWLDFTGWKTSKCGVILACILLHSDLIQRDNPYPSVFSPNVGKYGPGKTPYLDTSRSAWLGSESPYFKKNSLIMNHEWIPDLVSTKCERAMTMNEVSTASGLTTV